MPPHLAKDGLNNKVFACYTTPWRYGPGPERRRKFCLRALLAVQVKEGRAEGGSLSRLKLRSTPAPKPTLIFLLDPFSLLGLSKYSVCLICFVPSRSHARRSHDDRKFCGVSFLYENLILLTFSGETRSKILSHHTNPLLGFQYSSLLWLPASAAIERASPSLPHEPCRIAAMRFWPSASSFSPRAGPSSCSAYAVGSGWSSTSRSMTGPSLLSRYAGGKRSI